MYHSISLNKKSTTILAFTISMVLLLSACSQKEQEKGQTQNEQAKPVNYKTAPLQVINPEYEISVPAELKPFEQVAVYAKVTGFVKQMYVDRGDRVRKGQLLAVLEAPKCNNSIFLINLQSKRFIVITCMQNRLMTDW
ncbi:efflux RND transporter periplasmic adaptor subunit [Niabella defluvii]|nr:efflux RND transporter periplasmic adaptor subunit [Niabella sp. I65]